MTSSSRLASCGGRRPNAVSRLIFGGADSDGAAIGIDLRNPSAMSVPIPRLPPANDPHRVRGSGRFQTSNRSKAAQRFRTRQRRVRSGLSKWRPPSGGALTASESRAGVVCHELKGSAISGEEGWS